MLHGCLLIVIVFYIWYNRHKLHHDQSTNYNNVLYECRAMLLDGPAIVVLDVEEHNTILEMCSLLCKETILRQFMVLCATVKINCSFEKCSNV